LNVYETSVDELSRTRGQANPSRRLNLKLTARAFEEVKRVADELGTSMTEVARLALGLVRIVVDERKNGNKVVVTNREGTTLKEIVLPH
jgi:hypothetical protein